MPRTMTSVGQLVGHATGVREPPDVDAIDGARGDAVQVRQELGGGYGRRVQEEHGRDALVLPMPTRPLMRAQTTVVRVMAGSSQPVAVLSMVLMYTCSVPLPVR